MDGYRTQGFASRRKRNPDLFGPTEPTTSGINRISYTPTEDEEEEEYGVDAYEDFEENDKDRSPVRFQLDGQELNLEAIQSSKGNRQKLTVYVDSHIVDILRTLKGRGQIDSYSSLVELAIKYYLKEHNQ